MGIVDEDIVRVRESTDIVAVISQYTALKRVGQRWTGLCPFHSEKSPSFSVDSSVGLYHCFGCKASGDAITFVREKEQLDFVGAIEWLAAKSGIVLRYTDRDQGQARQRLDRLFDVAERACEWYSERLRTSPDAAAARSYLRSRGFTAEEVVKFRVGWAPDGWDTMVKALRIPKDDLEDAGLGFQNKAGRLQDFFRARILFPIFDERGRVIGFGGRKMPGAEGAKYQNSRENKLYHKSRALYGLNWAKADAVNAGEMIICEGYTDVIGFARAGLDRAIATCGTALTEDHVKMIRRFTRRLVLAYDADSAGQAAADRVYEWEKSHDVEVAVVEMPPGSDPDEMAQSSPETLRELVTAAKPYLQFRVDRVLAGGDSRTPEGRARLGDAALEVVAEHPDDLVRDQYVMQVADACRLNEDLLRGRLRSIIRQPRKTAISPTGPRRRRDEGSDFRDPSEPLPQYSGEAPADPDGHRHGPFDQRPVRVEAIRDGVDTEALRLAIQHPEHVEGFLTPVLFTHPTVRAAFERLGGASSVADAIIDAPQGEAELLTRLAVEPSEAESTDVLVRLATEVGRAVLADLEASARASEDPLAYSTSITWLKISLDELRQPKAEVEKLTQLLVWLGDRRKESEQG